MNLNYHLGGTDPFKDSQLFCSTKTDIRFGRGFGCAFLVVLAQVWPWFWPWTSCGFGSDLVVVLAADFLRFWLRFGRGSGCGFLAVLTQVWSWFCLRISCGFGFDLLWFWLRILCGFGSDLVVVLAADSLWFWLRFGCASGCEFLVVLTPSWSWFWLRIPCGFDSDLIVVLVADFLRFWLRLGRGSERGLLVVLAPTWSWFWPRTCCGFGSVMILRCTTPLWSLGTGPDVCLSHLEIWTVGAWSTFGIVLRNTIGRFRRVVPNTNCRPIFVGMKQMVGHVTDVPHLNICRAIIHLVNTRRYSFLYFYWVHDFRVKKCRSKVGVLQIDYLFCNCVTIT